MIRILFAGSPEAAKKTLEILNNAKAEADFEIAGVLSNPPSAKGRHKELIPTPVAAYAGNVLHHHVKNTLSFIQRDDIILSSRIFCVDGQHDIGAIEIL